MFHADIAELVLPDQKAKDHLASRVGPGEAVAILTPIDLDPTQGVWARVIAEGEGVLLARPIRNPLLAEHFSSLGINDAIVAPVGCEDGPLRHPDDRKPSRGLQDLRYRGPPPA